MPFRTLELVEAADYLNISQENLERLVKYNDIPFERKGERIIFRKIELENWATQLLLSEPEKHLAKFHKASTAKRKNEAVEQGVIKTYLNDTYIDAYMECKTKPSVLYDMVELADRTGCVQLKDDLQKGVKDREKQCSTVLPGGLALLHSVYHEPYMFSSSFIVMGRTMRGIPFGAPNGQLTRLFFLICMRDDNMHLHVLSRLCMMCHHTDLLSRLEEVETSKKMYEALLAAEVEVMSKDL